MLGELQHHTLKRVATPCLGALELPRSGEVARLPIGGARMGRAMQG